MISNNNPHSDDDSFGGAFGGAFGGSFGVKFNSDGSTSKVETTEEKEVEVKKPARKTKKVEVVTPKEPRVSSRTFAAAHHTSTAKTESSKKSSDSSADAWMRDIGLTYEKTKPVQPAPTPVVEAHIEPEVKTATPAQSLSGFAPTPFKSKIITAEDRKKMAAESTATKAAVTAASNDRGTAFAKTFLKGGTGIKPRPRPTHASTPYKPSTPARPRFEPRIRKPKVKNAPTLKTRVSGKSTQHIAQFKKEIGNDIRAKAPVVVIMGHVDHGKSTLLDYIRSSNTADREVGGITQKMSAYEIVHNGQSITFLDTPGHEAFNSMRTRGARAADIAILVVSAEDGVKPQTLDALRSIEEAGVPYFIGASKIDRTGADIEKTKQSLAENNVFVEGYGGDITLLPFSGKTGAGVPELLDMILLMAEVAETKAAFDVPAECLVIESGRDKVRGIHATLIVKNGTLTQGSFLVSGGEISPVRIMENYEGKAIKEAVPGQPVRIVGWTAAPHVGDMCVMAKDKEAAELVAKEQKDLITLNAEMNKTEAKKAASVNIRALYGLEKNDTWTLPIVLKADSVGTLDAVKQEIEKIKLNRIEIKVIRAETGDINENDIKLAQGSKDSIVIGYNTKVDAQARRVADTQKTTIETFDIIYKLSEWLIDEAKARAPKITTEEAHGQIKILKTFSLNKNKQVLGGRVESGRLSVGDTVKIIRRENEIGRGVIGEMQQMRVSVKSVEAENECGLMVESKIEIVSGDVLHAVSVIELQ